MLDNTQLTALRPVYASKLTVGQHEVIRCTDRAELIADNVERLRAVVAYFKSPADLAELGVRPGKPDIIITGNLWHLIEQNPNLLDAALAAMEQRCNCAAVEIPAKGRGSDHTWFCVAELRTDENCIVFRDAVKDESRLLPGHPNKVGVDAVIGFKIF